MITASQTSIQAANPILDAAHFDQLQGIASRSQATAPDLADALLDTIERAEVRATASMPPNVINIGSEVTIEEDDGCVQTLRLVFPADADIGKRHISVLTPVGAALIGLSEGQEAEWTTRDGKSRRAIIVKVA